jgi:hypothetical protein
MTEDNVPGSEYVSVPADNISSWDTSSRGTVLLEEQTLNNAKSLIYRAGIRTPTIFKTEGQNFKSNNSNNNDNNSIYFN